MKKIEVYMSEDGNIFNTEAACAEHESKMLDNSVNALTLDFVRPLKSFTDGEIVLFTAHSKEEYKKFTEAIKDKHRADDIYGESCTDESYPRKFILVCPESYEWVDIFPLDRVADDLLTFATTVSNYAKGE